MKEQRQRDPDQAARVARLSIAAGVAYLLYLTFNPFFTPIAWSAVLSYALYPLYKRLVRALKGHKTVSALIMCSVMTIVIILPLLYLSAQIGTELVKTYKSMAALVSEAGAFEETLKDYPIIGIVIDRVQEYEQLTGTNVRAMIAENVDDIGRWVFEKATLVATNVLIGFFELAFILVCSFYFFLDGERAVKWIEMALPISHEQQRIVFKRFDEVVIASVQGSTIVAILEGVIGGLAFWIAGLPTPVLWGAVMGVLAYIPAAGASLVWIPGVLYLWSAQAYGEMAVVLVAGGIIAFVDHVLRTILVGTRSKLHPLLVFFSVLGGIRVFGLLGIVAGPLVVAIGRALLDIYRMEKIGSLEVPRGLKH